MTRSERSRFKSDQKQILVKKYSKSMLDISEVGCRICHSRCTTSSISSGRYITLAREKHTCAGDSLFCNKCDFFKLTGSFNMNDKGIGTVIFRMVTFGLYMKVITWLVYVYTKLILVNGLSNRNLVK